MAFAQLGPPVQALLAALAGFTAVTVIFGLAFLLCHRNPFSKKKTNKNDTQLRTITQDPAESFQPVAASFDPSVPLISMPDLVTATDNFSPSRVIGDGGFGLVYRAHIPPNGIPVAVKRLSPHAFHGLREFHAEMETLSRVKHPNLVRLLAYCVSGPDRLLVYPLLPQGSLYRCLHDPDDNGDMQPRDNTQPHPLSWGTRAKIIRGVANGLAYLHDGQPRIIHRDIKSGNILLDSDFNASITDFGLARRMNPQHTHVSTQVAGTMGYMPPEYYGGLSVATVMGDVYSFGVLTLEVVSGRRPDQAVGDEGERLGEWVKRLMRQSKEKEVVAPGVEGLVEEEVREFLRVGCMCIAETPKERPSMKEVVHMLQHPQ
ncbi:hypothetical protein AMTRI_Chr11g156060 [Amborella trichopoda]|uniref:Protein kinase domain-containing protein n=1 Tax=Amborella trichopoda TaxID=13333 RepID=W1PM06_AMBTC|nr:phytosulfokine receptor 1 [Amborella trichopoda]ERN08701.1 hypothetical protein AMTR_s00017p00228450 [Amborella trichopoda]|eukprot:XP_006847120.1 phytosulfokine receptor 1 [Amborella trichopoda]